MRKYAVCVFFVCFLCCFAAACGQADQPLAKNVAGDCVYHATADTAHRHYVSQANLERYWDGAGTGILSVELPRRQTCQGIAISFYNCRPEIVVESLDQPDYPLIARYTAGRYNDYIPFSAPVHAFRIRLAEGCQEPLRINRLQVLTPGTLPEWVQQWTPVPKKADVLLVATHPDDEVLWFGGLLPTLAGEEQKQVVVAFTRIGPTVVRRNELLDALWTCGVRIYPILPDGENPENFTQYITAAVRRCRPDVVYTQDINGEYGHSYHKKTVKAVIKAVTEKAAQAKYDKASAKQYGVWQPEELWLHLWPENQVVFNWNIPLKAFGGQTGLTVAKAAFRKHVTQQYGKYAVLDSGPYDCRIFGLYWQKPAQAE